MSIKKKIIGVSLLIMTFSFCGILQAQTCTKVPTCTELGYNDTSCESGKALKCPFDNSKLFCVGNADGNTGGSGNPNDNGESLNFLMTVAEANTEISITISGLATIDWGDGTVEDVYGSGSGTEFKHIYALANRSYNFKLIGSPTAVNRLKNARVIELKNIYLPSVKDYSFLFYGHYEMTGDLSKIKFPDGLEIAKGMFANCSGLTGNIPTLPSGLKIAGDGLYDRYYDGRGMFEGCKGFTGFAFSSFPSGLENGVRMFKGCTGLTGNIPTLPSGLTNGKDMFYGCTGLTGFGFSSFPSGLENGEEMFYGCKNLTGSIPTLPSSLNNGRKMFYDCNGLRGQCPTKPDSLHCGTTENTYNDPCYFMYTVWVTCDYGIGL